MKTRKPNLMVALTLLALSTVNLQLATAFGRGSAFSRLLKICAVAVLINTAVSLHATVWTVTSLADSGPGSLRQTVILGSPGDTIQFAVTGKILLSSSISIPYNNLTVQGPGPAALTVDAGGVDRAFTISGTGAFLSGMTISNGLVLGANGSDGALFQDGSAGGDAYGGAIYDSAGALLLSNCWITGNTAIGGHGGRGGNDYPSALYKQPGNGGLGGSAFGGAVYDPNVSTNFNCTFSQNRAIGGQGGDGGDDLSSVPVPPITGGNGGGGQFSAGGALWGTYLTNINCTFSGNTVTGYAGGKGGDSIGGGNPGGNGGGSSANSGGAIFCVGSDFLSCTIVSNSALAGAGGLGGSGSPPGATAPPNVASAGGVYAYIYAGCINHIANSILADNYADTSYTNYYAAWTDLGCNFIGSVDYIPGCPFGPTTQAGTIALPIHPYLGPLAQNGGGLPTHAPVFGGSPLIVSPVIDAGFSFGLTADERGAPRPYSFGLPRPPGGDGSDIGAVELGSSGLGLGMASNNVVISWPAYYGDLTLQSSSNLLAPGSWMSVTDLPVVVGNSFVVTNIPSGPGRFYRLTSH